MQKTKQIEQQRFYSFLAPVVIVASMLVYTQLPTGPYIQSYAFLNSNEYACIFAIELQGTSIKKYGIPQFSGYVLAGATLAGCKVQ